MASRLNDNETGLVSAALRLDIGKHDGVQMKELRVDLTYHTSRDIQLESGHVFQQALIRCAAVLNERLHTAGDDPVKRAAVFSLCEGEMVAILNREIGDAHGISFKRFIAVKVEPSVEAMALAMGKKLHEMDEQPLN